MGSAAAPLLSSLYPHLALANTISLWGEMTQTVFGNIHLLTQSQQTRPIWSLQLTTELSKRDDEFSWSGLPWNVLFMRHPIHFMQHYQRSECVPDNSGWGHESSVSGMRRFKCGGEEEYIDHNWGAGPGWRWRCGAEIGVLSHLMDYSSTWGSSSGCGRRKGEGAGVS